MEQSNPQNSQTSERNLQRIQSNQREKNKNRNFAWIFLIDQENIYKKIKDQQKKEKIKTTIQNFLLMYQPYQKSQNFKIPICKNIKETQDFLKCRNNEKICFKFVVDYQNTLDLFQKVLQTSKIVEVHTWNICNNEKYGQQQFEKLRNKSFGVYKSIEADLQTIFKKYQQQIDNSRKFLHNRNRNQIYLASRITSVSSVFVIEDKKDIHKQINFFRKRLYENISIPEIKLKKDLLIEIIEYFKRKVGSKYSKQPQKKQKEQKQIDLYKELTQNLLQFEQKQNISKFGWKNNQKMRDFAKKFCYFYSKENFFYSQISYMLNFTQSSQYNQLIKLPFYQLYNSIKILYDEKKQAYFNLLKQKGITELTVYRGFKLSQDIYDARQLKGRYIQILGFGSSSKNPKIAMDFVDKDFPILLKINIKINKILENSLQTYLDHGFLDFNLMDVNSQRQQQEVLLNCLNIFKVINVQQKNTELDCMIIQAQYGSIFQLKQQIIQKNSYQQKVFKNFNYCNKILNKNQKIIQQRNKIFLKIQKKQISVDINELLNVTQLELQQGNLQFAQQYLNLCFKNQNFLNEMKTFKENKMNYVQIESIQKIRKKLKTSNKKIIQNAYAVESYEQIYNGIKNYQQLTLDRNWQQNYNLQIEKGNYYKFKGEIINSLRSYQKAEDIILKQWSPYKKMQEKIKNSFSCCFNKYSTEDKINQINQEIFINLSPKLFQCLYQTQNKILDLLEFMRNKQKIQNYRQKLKQTKQKIIQMKQVEEKEVNNNNSTQNLIKQSSIQFQLSLRDQIQRHTYTKALQQQIQKIQKQLSIFDLPQQLVSMKEQLSQLNFLYCKRILNQKKSYKLKKNKSKIDKQFNIGQNQKKEILLKTRQSLTKLQQTFNIIHHSSHPKIFKVRNKITQLWIFQQNFQQARKLLKKNLNQINSRRYSQGSKSALLFSKVLYELGEYQQSLHYAQLSEEILKQFIWKNKPIIQSEQTGLQKIIYQSSHIHYEINLQKVKIFNESFSKLDEIKDELLKQIQQKKAYFIYNIDVEIQSLKQRAVWYWQKKNLYQFQKNMNSAIELIKQEYDEFHHKRAQYFLFAYRRRENYDKLNQQLNKQLNNQQNLNSGEKICRELQNQGQNTHYFKWMVFIGKSFKKFKLTSKRQYIQSLKQTLQQFKQYEKYYSRSAINYLYPKYSTLRVLASEMYDQYIQNKNLIKQQHFKSINQIFQELDNHKELIQKQIENNKQKFSRIIGVKRTEIFCKQQDMKKYILASKSWEKIENLRIQTNKKQIKRQQNNSSKIILDSEITLNFINVFQ